MGLRVEDVQPSGNFVRTVHTLDISKTVLQGASIINRGDGSLTMPSTYCTLAVLLGGTTIDNVSVILQQGWVGRSYGLGWTGRIDAPNDCYLAYLIQTIANDTHRLMAWTSDRLFRPSILRDANA